MASKEILINKIYKHLGNKEINDIISLLSEKTLYLIYKETKELNLEKGDDIQSDEKKYNKQNKKEDNNDNSNILYVFTDGNCKNNGKRNAIGACGIYFTDNKTNAYYKFNQVEKVDDATNQKCELMAFKNLFKLIHDESHYFTNKKIIICSDSMYSINCISKWYLNWYKNNWKTAKGQDVKNSEIIKEILYYKNQIKNNIEFEFKHVMSHLPEPSKENDLKYKLWYGNNMVDKMINEFIDK